MSHPLLWPRSFFYPIGNSSPVCLTDNLPPESPASVLSLGCGDPRNILYTLHVDSPIHRPTLDFVCCDIEPAVLARNVLLFSLIYDNHPNKRVWNIFYHIKLDKASFALLISQCKNLVVLTKDLESWHQSPYSKFLKFCSRYTLSQVHNHLGLYAQSEGFSDAKHTQLFSCFTREWEARRDHKLIHDTSSSSGLLSTKILPITTVHFHHYWKTGIVYVSSAEVAAATLVNPTFIHSNSSTPSLVGDQCSLHYGTYPLQGFHLASAVVHCASGDGTIVDDLVSCAQSQFEQWCLNFKKTVSQLPVTIQLLAGDALALCQKLSHLKGGSNVQSYVSPWSVMELLLDGDFDASTATTGFDTIETSNIADHVGVLNVLITAVPLLARRPSSVLHTSLLIDKDEGKTKPSNLPKLLCADISAISILLGVAPVGCVSQFTSSTKTHEILDSASYRERISWKCPYLTDTQSDITPSFSDARALANLLFGIYEQMFADEDMAKMMSRSEPGLDIFHYHRATFAALLGVVKSRIRSDWSAVMHHIFDRLHKDRTLLMGSNNYQEFCCQLLLRGVYEVDILSKPPPISRNHSLFREWKKVPSVVSLVLVVPREKIRILEARRRGSPMFQCELQGRTFTNIFSSIRAVLGTVSVHGTGNDTRVDITEDPKGWSGTAPLIVSVSLPTFNLLVDEPRYMRISLGLHPTPSTSAGFARNLGLQLQLYTTNIMDTAHVHITDMPGRILPISSPKQDVSSVSVTLDDDCRISSMSARWVPQISLKGVGVSHVQMSPCAIRVQIGGREKDLVYPFPIDGSKTKVKIARTSGWIELEVPVRPLLASANLSFTTAVVQNQYPIVWGIHRLNLDSLALLPGDIQSQQHPMINFNCFLAMSDREHALGVESLSENPLALVKHTILQLFGHFVDPTTKPRPFIFSDPENGGMYTVLYVNGIRVDAASHTYVMDACVLTLTKDLVKGPRGPYIVALLSELDAEDIITVGKEVGAWKHLLVAFAERCRTWSHKKTCKYGIFGMPVSKDIFENPLCDCGAGVGLGAILQDVLWTPFAPLMTRVAISPLFALPYLETVKERLDKDVCAACDKPGYIKQAKLLKCGRCKVVQYCGKVCQLAHWREHKSVCKAV